MGNHTNANSRRVLLKTLSLAGISGLLLPRRLLYADTTANSRVIIVEDAAATSGSSINATVVQTMINKGISSLAQVGNVGEAWKTLLPGVTASSTIALKVNCLFAFATHPVVTQAVATSLQQMNFGGTMFPANHIIIYDRTDGDLTQGGYTINKTTTGVRCMGTTSYTTATYDVAGVTQRLSTILTSTADFLVNLAILKNHSMSGVTLCLKNHYGTCDNPGALHNTDCDPYIAALSATPPIKAKQKVNIIDALFGIRSGGPGGAAQFTTRKFIMSTDAVAADTCGRQLLLDNGCTTTAQATHIDTAATTYALGTNNTANMDIITISNPSGVEENRPAVPFQTRLEQNYPNPFNPVTHFQYMLARDSNVKLGVYDLSGRQVALLVDAFLPAGPHTAKFDGTGLSCGMYVFRLHTAGAQLSRKMTLLK